MKGRAIHPPKELEEFFDRSDPSSYKNARPNFDYNCLNCHTNLLFGYLNAPWMENSQFTWLYPIVALVEIISFGTKAIRQKFANSVT